jgi:transposase
MERKVTLNKKEQNRLLVIGKVDRKEIGAPQAAVVLGISLRQLRRLVAGYRVGGAEALAHGNRGRKPANATAEAVRQRVLDLARSRYIGFNTQHLTEKLTERDGIDVSRSTVRRLLIDGAVKRPRKRRAPKHRSRRERYPQRGMLVQLDGSRHDWLEGRGPWMTLIGAIDDATGTVLHALFREQEDTQGYFELMEEVVSRYGVPLAVYHDGHAVFEAAEHEPMTLEEQLEGKKAVTQFGRLLNELDINSIRSLSPQARGRVERLWGTFQHRLVSELRLARVRTLNDANEMLRKYLPLHNQKFAVPPANAGDSFRRPPGNWRAFLCLKYPRTVGNDNVVRFDDRRLQILPDARYSYARAKVEVWEAFDGTIAVYYQGRRLETRPAPAEAPKLRQPATNGQPQPRKSSTPPPDSAWRRSMGYFFDGPPRR